SAMSAPATASAQLASGSTKMGIVSEPFYSICFRRFRQADSACRIAFFQKLVKSANGLRFAADRRGGFFDRNPAENVEMRPFFSLLDKSVEEECSRHRSGETVGGDIIEVGNPRGEFLRIGLPKRHPPQRISCCIRVV